LGDEEQDVREDSFVGGRELAGGAPFDVTRPFVLETRKTALFAARGESRVAFRHGSISAYLAARYIVTRDMGRDQLESLLLVAAPDESRSIPPPLRETAAWLASLSPVHADWLARVDPESLVAHSRLLYVPEVRRAVVAALIERAPEVSWVTSRGVTVGGGSTIRDSANSSAACSRPHASGADLK
jgi:hypothetical protein